MIALIDGDVLLYQFGSCKDDEGHPLKWPFVQQRLDAKIHGIAEDAEASDYVIHLSGDNNFRKDVATIRPYKGNRPSEKPFWHAKVKDYLSSSRKHKVFIAEGMEADDSMSIDQCASNGTTVICSPDKDLKMVPGYHYQWSTTTLKEKPRWLVTEEEGLLWFFTQLLMGDPTDNIPGLYGIGGVKAKKILDGTETPLQMYERVKKEYELRFGSYWKMFMDENAKLLWMLRTPDDDIAERLQEYDSQIVSEDTREF